MKEGRPAQLQVIALDDVERRPVEGVARAGSEVGLFWKHLTVAELPPGTRLPPGQRGSWAIVYVQMDAGRIVRIVYRRIIEGVYDERNGVGPGPVARHPVYLYENVLVFWVCPHGRQVHEILVSAHGHGNPLCLPTVEEAVTIAIHDTLRRTPVPILIGYPRPHRLFVADVKAARAQVRDPLPAGVCLDSHPAMHLTRIPSHKRGYL